VSDSIPLPNADRAFVLPATLATNVTDCSDFSA